VNNDGFGDVAIGAPNDSLQTTNAGTVYLFKGTPSGPDVTTVPIIIGQLGDQFGGSIAALGDLNQDGLPDFAVGSTKGAFIFFGSGTTFVGIRSVTTAEIKITGPTTSGYAVSSAGDINQDGKPDFAIADPSGNVYIFFDGTKFQSPITLTLADADVTLSTGSANLPTLSSAGNVDKFNQGLISRFGDDFLVGVPSAQKAYLILGSQGNIPANTTITSYANITFTSTESNDKFGTGLAGIGDFDNDGTDDLAIGAPGSGKVYIYFGQPNLGPSTTDPMIITPEASTDLTGQAIAGTPSIALSNVFPVFFGAPGNAFGGSGAGSAYLLSRNLFASGGSFHGITVAAVTSDQVIRSPFSGFGSNGAFGSLIKTGGDVNGDGSPDLLIGSPTASAGPMNAGAVEIFW
jgi:hypothetical protein